MDNLDLLYEKYNILNDAGDKASEHEPDYLHILEAVKGSANEKRLASQFIAKFFKHFPQHSDRAIDALVDLCEDEDVAIRKQAIRDLPTICKESKEFVSKITDLLTQLLVGEDASDLQLVTSSLLILFRLHPQNFLNGIFMQIEIGDDVTREKAIKFLSSKIKSLPEDAWTKEVEDCLLQCCRKAMQDCTKDEFTTFISLLSNLKISKLVSGQQVLAEIIAEQAELDKPYDVEDVEITDKLLMCVKCALPYLSPFVTSNAYVSYLTLQVLPAMDRVVELMSVEVPGIDLEVLQLLAELVPSVHPSNLTKPIDIAACQVQVFNKMLKYMPLPPPIDTETTSDQVDEPSLQLTHVESLLYAFHQLGKHNADILSDEARLKDFKLRLQYLARSVQIYSKKLKESLEVAKKTKDGMQSEENKLRLVALKTTNNINTLTRDLFHIPPSFKSQLTLSWKPVAAKTPLTKQAKFGKQTVQKTKTAAAVVVAEPKEVEVEKGVGDENGSSGQKKRKAIEAPEGTAEKVIKKNERQIYAPPSGKFSGNSNSNRGTHYPARGRGTWTRGGSNFRGRYAKRFN